MSALVAAPTCKTCNMGWVCENHPDKPSDVPGDHPEACHCGGAGMPCPACGGNFNSPETESK